MGEKLGGCWYLGGFKKIQKFKNLPLQVPPQTLSIFLIVSIILYCNIVVIICVNS